MAKRLKPARDCALSVISDNTAYPSWIIPAQERDQNLVVGRIVWCARFSLKNTTNWIVRVGGLLF